MRLFVCLFQAGVLTTSESIPEHILLLGDARDDIIDVTPLAHPDSDAHSSTLSQPDVAASDDGFSSSSSRYLSSASSASAYPSLSSSSAAAAAAAAPSQRLASASFVLDGDWKEHLTALKPLGLAAMLTSECMTHQV
jgi:hypothetical protein